MEEYSNIIISSNINNVSSQIMKKVILLFNLIFIGFLNTFSQTWNERIAQAMNDSDWFKLDSLYKESPKDSISGFIEVYSRCLIGNRLNRTDISIPAFSELFNNYSQDLDMSNLISSAIMYAMDLSRIGQNEAATNLLSSIIDAVSPHLEKSQLKHLEQFRSLYKGLSNFKPYSLIFEDNGTGTIPFRIVSAGPKEKEGKLMILENSTINGIPADFIFDTGAGVNVITESLAQKYNLLTLYAELDAKGIGNETGRFVIANELKLGNIIVNDVPFLVLSMVANNTEADQYLKKMNLILGSELMLQLKDLTLDFQNNQIIVPSGAPVRSNEKPNMCFSSTMNLLTSATIENTLLLIRIDTGDVSFGTLDYAFYKRNENLIKQTSKKETLRLAGMGGTTKTKCYNTPNLKLNLGNNSVTLPRIAVIANKNSQIKNNFGLKALMLFGKVRFNLVDFLLSTEPRANFI